MSSPKRPEVTFESTPGVTSSSSTHVEKRAATAEVCLSRGGYKACLGRTGIDAFLGSSDDKSGAKFSTPGATFRVDTPSSLTTVGLRGSIGLTKTSDTVDVGAGPSVSHTTKPSGGK